jgi:hypothetical protein
MNPFPVSGLRCRQIGGRAERPLRLNYPNAPRVLRPVVRTRAPRPCLAFAGRVLRVLVFALGAA